MFILLGILVNVGVNSEHRYIGGENWRLPGAPFVGGFGGFARVFVTASFACTSPRLFLTLSIHTKYILLDGGTESLGITAGETKNPSQNMPRVVKFVFWRYVVPCSTGRCILIECSSRILIFYIVSILLLGLNGKKYSFLLRDKPETDAQLVPYTYPDLSNRSAVTSPFTIVFRQIGSGEVEPISSWSFS